MVKYKIKICNVQRVKGESVVTEQVVLIVQSIKVNQDSVDIPHPISAFPLHMSRVINTQKAYANAVCSFLNFIQKEIESNNPEFDELKQKGLAELKFKHGSQYLNYCGDNLGNSKDTVKYKEHILLKFYDYLIIKGILNDKKMVLEKETYTDYKGDTITKIKNPFNNLDLRVHYPAKANDIEKRKNMSTQLWHLLLEVCDMYAPEITLGLFFQIMGGLRMGEVVNLTIDAITLNDNSSGMTLHIQDRQSRLFKNRKVDLSSSQVKKERLNQMVMDPYKELDYIYNRHLKLINDIKSETSPECKDALFYNSKGLPLTGENYRDRFYKVKNKFLEILKEKSYSDYVSLKQMKWGTHIGRGIYTNYLIEHGLVDTIDGQLNARVLASLRGDKSESSAQAYIDNFTIREDVKRKINNIGKDYGKH